MDINDLANLYAIIAKSTSLIKEAQSGIHLRYKILNPIIKQAFDTRRINQETQFNPRRGLQNYHRSEAFISEAMVIKINGFTKLQTILNGLKSKYGREPEWQDSYARVLLNTLNQSLEKNGDYTETQPSIGSFDYIEELLSTRYRLDMNNIASYGEETLTDIILGKDEVLTRKGFIPKFEITKQDISTQPYDSLMNKLFDGIKASKEHPNIKRSVTITIEDNFIEKE
jgi:hypothetical protein